MDRQPQAGKGEEPLPACLPCPVDGGATGGCSVCSSCMAHHRAADDDVFLLLACLPRQVRWTACTQDICFKSDALAAFFGAGKVMPIHR